jgi:hypothetical protein
MIEGALSAFASSRDRTIAYLQSLQEDPRMHPHRHVGQIQDAIAAAR